MSFEKFHYDWKRNIGIAAIQILLISRQTQNILYVLDSTSFFAMKIISFLVMQSFVQ